MLDTFWILDNLTYVGTSVSPVLVLHLSTPFHSQALRQLFLYFAFPLKHGIEHTFLPVHIQLPILLLVSLGKGVEIRALLHPPVSNLNLLLHACDLPLPHSHCWTGLAPKYGEPPICVLDPCTSFPLQNIPRIFLLNVSTSSGFFFFLLQLSYAHYYSNDLFLILKKNHPLTHTPCNYYSKHLLFFPWKHLERVLCTHCLVCLPIHS